MEITDFGATLHAWWTVWLVMVFIGIIVYAVWPGNRAKFEHASTIPFVDENKEV
ncbi:MAG: cbb3-type cytochrome c oxidase subunit 3 [Rhodospirillaceae bacterium]